MQTLELLDNKNYLVTRKNDIIQKTTNHFNLIEKKLLLIAISKIKQSDVPDQIYELKIGELVEILGMKSGGYSYSLIKDSIKSLSDKSEWYHDSDLKKDVLVRWFVEVEHANGVISFSFQRNIRKYIFEIKELFTEFELWNVLLLKNKTTIDLYEYLKSYANLKYIEIPLNEFEDKFNLKYVSKDTDEAKELEKGIEKGIYTKIEKLENVVDSDNARKTFYKKKGDKNPFLFYKINEDFYVRKYKRYTDIKRFLISNAQKEINEFTDLKFTFDEIYEGRKVVGISFYITILQGSEFLARKHKIEQDLLDLHINKKDLKQVKKERKKKLVN